MNTNMKELNLNEMKQACGGEIKFVPGSLPDPRPKHDPESKPFPFDPIKAAR